MVKLFCTGNDGIYIIRLTKLLLIPVILTTALNNFLPHILSSRSLDPCAVFELTPNTSIDLQHNAVCIITMLLYVCSIYYRQKSSWFHAQIFHSSRSTKEFGDSMSACSDTGTHGEGYQSKRPHLVMLFKKVVVRCTTQDWSAILRIYGICSNLVKPIFSAFVLVIICMLNPLSKGTLSMVTNY